MDLWEMSLSGGLLILAVAAVRAALAGYLPRRAFLVLWGIVLLRLCVPVRIPSALSVYSWAAWENEGTGTKLPQSGQQEEPGRAVLSPKGAGDAGKEQKQGMKNTGGNAGFFTAPGGILEGNALRAAWAAGCVLCLAVYFLAYVRCRRSFAYSLPVRNGFAQSWVRRHRHWRPVQIRQCAAVNTPLTYGILSPVILMPVHTDWENTKQLSYVLEHEYIHIRRLDALAKLVLLLAVSVHWFNPAVWLFQALCSRDLELSCDEAVIRCFGSHARAEYARVLISMEEEKKRGPALYSSFGRTAMEERIVAVMKTKKKSVAAVAGAAAAVCLTAAVFGTSADAESSREGREILMHAAGEDSETAVQKAGEDSGKSAYAAGQDSGTAGQEAGEDSEKSAHAAGKTGENGAQVVYKTAQKHEETLVNENEYISDSQANQVFQQIKHNLEGQYAGWYSFDNYHVTFCRDMASPDAENIKDGMVSADIELQADMTSISLPQDSAYMLGMKDAIEEISDAGQKEAAQGLYDKYLQEMMAYYGKTETTGFSYRVQFPENAGSGRDFQFQLFHRVDAQDGAILTPDTDAHEPPFFTRQDGREYMMESLKMQQEGIKAWRKQSQK